MLLVQQVVEALLQTRCGKPILNLKAQQDYISHKNHRPKAPQEFNQALKQRQHTSTLLMDNNISHTSETHGQIPSSFLIRISSHNNYTLAPLLNTLIRIFQPLSVSG
jgi:hypothetical protein